MMVDAAQVATRCSPDAKRYYERLLRKKHKHVPRVALARRLLIALYALLRDSVRFDEQKVCSEVRGIRQLEVILCSATNRSLSVARGTQGMSGLRRSL
jgi:hypothetical protein